MKPISNPEAALLGLLSEGPKHAYQLEKDVQWRSMRVWTDLSMSSIYKLLRGLEKRGLVGGRSMISEGNRTRKVYELTPSGESQLEERLVHLLTEPDLPKWPLHVALSFMGKIPVEKVRSCLTTYRDSVRERIASYRELEAFLIGDGCPDYRLNLARHPIYLFEGELRWAEDYLASLEGAETLP